MTASHEGARGNAFDAELRPAAVSLSRLHLIGGLAVALVFALLSVVPVQAQQLTCHGFGVTILGTTGNDVLTGTDGDDVIIALGGADTISAGAGRDHVCAGPGIDVVDGGTGGDVISGGAGRDDLRGGDGHDVIAGGLGNDLIRGQAGHDRISGGPGSDTLQGGIGDDAIAGRDGDDELTGGPGNDLLLSLQGADLLSGNNGHDYLETADGIGDDTLRGGRHQDHCVRDNQRPRLGGSDQAATCEALSLKDYLDLTGTAPEEFDAVRNILLEADGASGDSGEALQPPTLCGSSKSVTRDDPKCSPEPSTGPLPSP